MAAKDDKDLDLDTDNTGKSKTNLLIIILIIVILAVGGGVAAMFLLGGGDKDAEDKAADNAGGGQLPTKAAAIYSTLRPTFIINFEDTSKARYLQVDIAVMSRNQSAIDLTQEHLPVIRNNIITILSGQTFDALNTRKGKEKLRADILKSINNTITAEVTNTPTPAAEEDSDDQPASYPAGTAYIESVYFTSLIMQ